MSTEIIDAECMYCGRKWELRPWERLPKCIICNEAKEIRITRRGDRVDYYRDPKAEEEKLKKKTEAKIDFSDAPESKKPPEEEADLMEQFNRLLSEGNGAGIDWSNMD